MEKKLKTEEIISLINYYRDTSDEEIDNNSLFNMIFDDIINDGYKISKNDFNNMFNDCIEELDGNNKMNIEEKKIVSKKKIKKIIDSSKTSGEMIISDFSKKETEIEEKIRNEIEEASDVIGDVTDPQKMKDQYKLFQEMLPSLLTNKHFVKIKNKDFATSLVSKDVIFLASDYDIKVDFKVINFPTGDAILQATAKVHDLIRNRKYESTVTESLVNAIKDDDGEIEYVKNYDKAYETAQTRAVRNAIITMYLPPKILKMLTKTKK